MRVLRLGTSNDHVGALPVDQQAWKVAGELVSEAAGVPVETVLKRIWPTPALGSVIERWIEESSPDVVLIQVNNYWYGHESVPLWFERHLGRAGRSLSDAGQRLSKSSGFADNRWLQMVNRRLVSILPKATHFTIEEVAACLEDAIRKVLSHEGVLVLVRGNEDWAKMPFATRGFNRRNAARNAAMSAAMRDVCARLRVSYHQQARLAAGDMQTLNGAGFHNSAEGERRSGELDARAITDAWVSAHPASQTRR